MIMRPTVLVQFHHPDKAHLVASAFEPLPHVPNKLRNVIWFPLNIWPIGQGDERRALLPESVWLAFDMKPCRGDDRGPHFLQSGFLSINQNQLMRRAFGGFRSTCLRRDK